MNENQQDEKKQDGALSKPVFFKQQRERLGGRSKFRVHEIAGGKVEAVKVEEEHAEQEEVIPDVTSDEATLTAEPEAEVEKKPSMFGRKKKS